MSASKSNIRVGDLVRRVASFRPAIVVERWDRVCKIQLIDEEGLRQRRECILTDQLVKITG